MTTEEHAKQLVTEFMNAGSVMSVRDAKQCAKLHCDKMWRQLQKCQDPHNSYMQETGQSIYDLMLYYVALKNQIKMIDQ